MKKVLCIAMTALMTVAVAHAEGDNEPGQLGLGYQGVVINSSDGPDVMNAIALRWAPQPIGGSVTIGQYAHSTEEDGGPDEWNTTAWTLQGKVLWTLIDRPNSDFYIGGLLGFGYYEDEFKTSGFKETDEWTSFIFGVLAGVEWRFTEIPEIGFNFEVGYNFETEDYEYKEPGFKYEEETLFGGTTVSLGATYYF